MTEFLEKLLIQKTSTSSSNVLYSQWVIDKKSISTAISAIPLFFPHFTLHDATHSDTILNRIVRLLGKEAFNNWAATDIWLLLEAAYCHDLGMVVTSDDLSNCFKSISFADHVQAILDDQGNPLHEHAKNFKVISDTVHLNANPLSADVYDSIRYVVSNYLRPIHGERSKEFVLRPKERLSMDLPRSLIPQRIYNLLSEICVSHTRAFEDVIKLPFVEVGVEYDDAHPRLIACLLRLGDLLDLDNDRYSEVFLRMVKTLPIDSTWHLQKIMSIEHFRLDSELVEVIAKCSDYDTQYVTQQWFNCLNEEYVNQQMIWHDIIPHKSYGTLPNIGSLQVILKDWEFIDSKSKPMFSVDSEKALILLQGAGLYNKKEQCIRELLQNSEDATLIKLWLEYGDDNNPWEEPQNFVDDERINESYIEVRITKQEELSSADQIKWSMEIIDQGYGMSLNDLKYLVVTGSSAKNESKRNIIRKMPEWLKPSGFFGIGFQSVFALTSSVTLETKSYQTEEALQVDLSSPKSKRKGAILIKRIDTTHRTKPGTKITFLFETKRNNLSWSVSLNHTYRNTAVQDFDPTVSPSFDYELWGVIEEILNFSSYSYVPIKLFVDNESVPIPTSLWHTNKGYYVAETGLEVSIHHPKWHNMAFYRNQSVEWKLETKFLTCFVNILKGSATEILTMNRNYIQPDYIQKINSQAMRSVFIAIRDNRSEINNNNELRMNASMFIEYYWNRHNEGDFVKTSFDDHWKQLSFSTNTGVDKKILDILQESTIRIREYRHNKQVDYDLSNEDGVLTLHVIHDRTPHNDDLIFAMKLISREFKGIRFVSVEEGTECFREILVTRTEDDDPIDDQLLLSTLKSVQSMWGAGSRMIVPCNECYDALRIRTTDEIFYMQDSLSNYNLPIEFPKMVAPFLYKLDSNGLTRTILDGNNKKLHEWVYRHRNSPNTTLEQIEAAYTKFVSDFQDVLPEPKDS